MAANGFTDLAGKCFGRHEARNWATSHAATIGFLPEDRDHLGRLGAAPTEQYLKTSREIVHQIQAAIAKALHTGDDRITEEPAVIHLRGYMLEAGVAAELVERQIAKLAWTPFVGKQDSTQIVPDFGEPDDHAAVAVTQGSSKTYFSFLRRTRSG